MPTHKPYNDDYIQTIKQIWYKAGHPNFMVKVIDLIPEDEYGRKPDTFLIQRWRTERMWDAWADEIDSRAMAIVEDGIIAEKAAMLQRQADVAKRLQDAGMAYLEEEGFDTASSAVQAVVRGAELERTSRGIGEMLVKMSKMNDTELQGEIIKYLNRASENNQIIDADLVPEKEETSTEDASPE